MSPRMAPENEQAVTLVRACFGSDSALAVKFEQWLKVACVTHAEASWFQFSGLVEWPEPQRSRIAITPLQDHAMTLLWKCVGAWGDEMGRFARYLVVTVNGRYWREGPSPGGLNDQVVAAAKCVSPTGPEFSVARGQGGVVADAVEVAVLQVSPVDGLRLPSEGVIDEVVEVISQSLG